MGILANIGSWISNMLWRNQAEEEFKVKLANRDASTTFIKECMDAYKGNPYWADDDIRTINMAQTVCAEVARLATLNIKVEISGSARARYLQEQIDKLNGELRQWVEFGCAGGQVIIKPNGYSIDVVFPDEMMITEAVGTDILGAIFIDDYYDPRNEKYYTRLEYHRIENGRYLISNRCYVGKERHDFEKRIDIKKTKWSLLSDEIVAEAVDKMLFGVFKLPNANNINPKSNYSLPIFSAAMEELSDVDVAYSRMTREIYDSKRTVLLDSDRLMASGSRVGQQQSDALVSSRGLPDFVKTIEGNGQGDIYHEINPTLNTTMRVSGLNNLLSQVGFKCGFSNGYFVFNEKTGMITATQVESDDRRTIQLIEDVRKQLKKCLDGLIYALDKFADAYNLAPRGTYEVTYDMDDITDNHQEDKMLWLSYVQQGHVPFWRYLVKFEGFTEEEAKELTEEQRREQQQAQMDMLGLYGQPT